ncbi:MAG: sigma-70 family RNA polymerase sigma factor [Blastocatellia bacterium]
MKTEDLNRQFSQEIAALWRGIPRRSGITEPAFAARLAVCLARTGNTGGPETREFLERVRAEELCLAMACEAGDEDAWRDFERAYRQTLQSAARALTRDEADAEELAGSLYGELYGARVETDESGASHRVSKLSHYAGRGSLGGWLRAVVYQTFIDRKRQAARFEQVEDGAEFDRIAVEAMTRSSGDSDIARHNGHFASLTHRPDDITDDRLRGLTEQSIQTAIQGLDTRDRLLLNYYYFDEMTLREIGLLMNVHEATICRWLAKAQQAVRKKTEENLRRAHGLRPAEISECLEMAARSEIDLRKMIGETAFPAAERAP